MTDSEMRIIFEYNEASPTFLYWTGENSKIFKVKTKAGSFKYREDGTPHNIEVMRDGKIYIVHRIIWRLLRGEIPTDMIVDHIDGNPFNNNIKNLRLTTQAINCRNRRIKSSNKTGVTGVCWITQGNNKSAKAEVRFEGRNYQKAFAAKKYGEQEAFNMAVKWREDKIKELNEKGQGYTERHGKPENSVV